MVGAKCDSHSLSQGFITHALFFCFVFVVLGPHSAELGATPRGPVTRTDSVTAQCPVRPLHPLILLTMSQRKSAILDGETEAQSSTKPLTEGPHSSEWQNQPQPELGPKATIWVTVPTVTAPTVRGENL